MRCSSGMRILARGLIQGPMSPGGGGNEREELEPYVPIVLREHASSDHEECAGRYTSVRNFNSEPAQLALRQADKNGSFA